MSPRAGLGVLEMKELLPLPEFQPRAVQPVASRYTNYATLALSLAAMSKNKLKKAIMAKSNAVNQHLLVKFE
jgi:hypothetical protein